MPARDRVGNVRESRGAFVGGDHQVRVFLVVYAGAHRMDNFHPGAVVGDIQQGIDVQRVTVADLVEGFVGGNLVDFLGDKSALELVLSI